MIQIHSNCISDTDTSPWMYHDTWYLILILYQDTYHDTCITDTPQHWIYRNFAYDLYDTRRAHSSLQAVWIVLFRFPPFSDRYFSAAFGRIVLHIIPIWWCEVCVECDCWENHITKVNEDMTVSPRNWQSCCSWSWYLNWTKRTCTDTCKKVLVAKRIFPVVCKSINALFFFLIVSVSTNEWWYWFD